MAYREELAQNWLLVAYPESCDPDFIQYLDDLHISFAVSPLHDLDVNADGEVKKPHYHIILNFDSKKSLSQVKSIAAAIGAVQPFRCLSMRGAVRYLIHLDNPEKHQYDAGQIITRGGFEVDKYLQYSSAQKHDLLSEILDWIDDNKCFEYCYLIQYARKNHEDWLDLLYESYTLLITNYINSFRNSYKGEQKIETS